MHDVARTVQVKQSMKTTRRAVGLAIAGVVALVILLAGIKAMQIAKVMRSPQMMPATTVTSTEVKEEDWAPILSSVGSVSAVQGAIVEIGRAHV